VTCDYRGFGLSTGNPTESGLITDSIAVVDYVLNTLGQPAYRTVLLGQSLGTAVGAATTLHYLDPGSKLIPYEVARPPSTRGKGGSGPITFAATVLAAPFTNLPDLLLTYRIMGFIPVLSPLRGYPRIQKMLSARIVDTWDTLSRLKAAMEAARKARLPLNVQILHSRNDPDINFKQSDLLFDGVAEAMHESGVEQSQIDERWTKDAAKVRRGAWAYKLSEDEFVDARQKRKLEMEITRFGGT
jgi:pimeloyl-ACP methyl ester carboxylesterase